MKLKKAKPNYVLIRKKNVTWVVCPPVHRNVSVFNAGESDHYNGYYSEDYPTFYIPLPYVIFAIYNERTGWGNYGHRKITGYSVYFSNKMPTENTKLCEHAFPQTCMDEYDIGVRQFASEKKMIEFLLDCFWSSSFDGSPISKSFRTWKGWEKIKNALKVKWRPTTLTIRNFNNEDEDG